MEVALPTDKTGNLDCHSMASLLRCKKSFSPFDGMRFNKRSAFYAFQKGQKIPAHSIQANGNCQKRREILMLRCGSGDNAARHGSRQDSDGCRQSSSMREDSRPRL